MFKVNKNKNSQIMKKLVNIVNLQQIEIINAKRRQMQYRNYLISKQNQNHSFEPIIIENKVSEPSENLESHEISDVLENLDSHLEENIKSDVLENIESEVIENTASYIENIEAVVKENIEAEVIENIESKKNDVPKRKKHFLLNIIFNKEKAL